MDRQYKIQTLQTLFPDLDASVIQGVLELHGWDTDASIDPLLEISHNIETEQIEAKEEAKRKEQEEQKKAEHNDLLERIRSLSMPAVPVEPSLEVSVGADWLIANERARQEEEDRRICEYIMKLEAEQFQQPLVNRTSEDQLLSEALKKANAVSPAEISAVKEENLRQRKQSQPAPIKFDVPEPSAPVAPESQTQSEWGVVASLQSELEMKDLEIAQLKSQLELHIQRTPTRVEQAYADLRQKLQVFKEEHAPSVNKLSQELEQFLVYLDSAFVTLKTRSLNAARTLREEIENWKLVNIIVDVTAKLREEVLSALENLSRRITQGKITESASEEEEKASLESYLESLKARDEQFRIAKEMQQMSILPDGSNRS